MAIDYSVYFDTVQQLYIGYYQRPADPEGLLYWSAGLASIDANKDGTINPGEDINSIVNQFATSEEAVAIYGHITPDNIGTVVNQIYESLFNRPAEPEGLAYWVNAFNNHLVTEGNILWEVMQGAQGTDEVSLANKVVAAEQFTQIIDPDLDGRPPFFASYGGIEDCQKAADWIAQVGFDPGTIPTAGIPSNRLS